MINYWQVGKLIQNQYKGVKVKDLKGTMVADELLFDIKNQTLDIASFNDSKINANVNLK